MNNVVKTINLVLGYKGIREDAYILEKLSVAFVYAVFVVDSRLFFNHG